MKGYIVYADYDTIEESTIVKFFGRLESGESFAITSKINPYFFIRSADLGKAKKLLANYNTEKTSLKNFQDEDVIKITHSNMTELNKLNKALYNMNIKTYEADIKPHNRYIIDNNILGTINIEGDYTSSEKINRIYANPEIKSVFYVPKLKVLSLDLESSKHNNKLYCIGMYSENYKKVFYVSDKKISNAINCKTEAECLEKFRAELAKFDPDIITGWNIIDFDLKYLESKFAEHKIPFDIGRDNSKARLRIESNFFRDSTADIAGRQVLDGLNLIQDPFLQEAPSIKNKKFESYTLENVSQEILGETKLIKGKARHDEIDKLYKSDPEKLVDYNLQDCRLVYRIIEETNIIDLAVQRTQLTGMTLNKLTASIASLDSLYIREARKAGLVSPTLEYVEKEERIKGGYVKDSKPGIYHNVLVLDFKSLYPSIITTFNIDPASLLEKKEKGAIESPNKAYFKNTNGILPQIIEKLHQEREKAKKEKRELASYAIKIIMNSFFGVLASPNCRYFSLDMANAITHFGQFIIKLTADEIEKKGYKVIYSDTDSVFVETGLNKDAANKLGVKLAQDINEFYNNYVKKNYNRKSLLELQFDKQFLSLMIPKLRTKNDEEAIGTKKRYAGLIEKNGKEEIVTVGIEAIRGDWTDAAKEFQLELLWKTFHKEPVEKFIADYVKKIRAGKMDDKLIYRKSIRKNLDEYTKTTPPHVKAARKLPSLESNIIEYYITEDGPEPKQLLKHKINYDHYIEKQIEPIAKQVLELIGTDFALVQSGSKQAKLF